MFIMANSDMPFNPQYLNKPIQLHSGISFTAAIGQTLVLQRAEFYVVSKLLDKKTSDSTLSRHILIVSKEVLQVKVLQDPKTG
jgi:peptidyl-prolyl cis-trans isomerase D